MLGTQAWHHQVPSMAGPGSTTRVPSASTWQGRAPHGQRDLYPPGLLSASPVSHQVLLAQGWPLRWG